MSDSPDEPSGASLSYSNILEREMENALQELGRPSRGLFVSGLNYGHIVLVGEVRAGLDDSGADTDE